MHRYNHIPSIPEKLRNELKMCAFYLAFSIEISKKIRSCPFLKLIERNEKQTHNSFIKYIVYWFSLTIHTYM